MRLYKAIYATVEADPFFPTSQDTVTVISAPGLDLVARQTRICSFILHWLDTPWTTPHAATMSAVPKHDISGTTLPGQQLPHPRRALAENSVTLGNYRRSRDASLRASAGSDSPDQVVNKSKSSSSLGRNSSGESNDTGHSDPKKWFDQSNKNPTATFDSNAMDGTSTSQRLRGPT